MGTVLVFGLPAEAGLSCPLSTKCWALKNAIFGSVMEASTRHLIRGEAADGTRIAINEEIFVGGATTASVFVVPGGAGA